jgi:hypothetical protein
MTNLFLKAKHWQIFIIAFAIPFLIQIISMPLLILSDHPLDVFKMMPIVMIFFVGGLMGWIWSIGVGLQSKIPTTVKLNVTLFKVFLTIPFVYLCVLSVAMAALMNGILENNQAPEPRTIVLLFVCIFPIHLFSMFCLFYCLYFAAKTVKTVEMQKEVAFADFGGEFVMMWFFPIGIWIIQPKINQMIEN